jgi:uncharacterized protein YaaR (DUF327 family)
MDKIESLEAFFFSKASERKKTKRGKTLPHSRFSSLLETAGGGSEGYDLMQAPLDLPLEELLDEVHESGEALIEAQSLENVKRYRQAVRSFLDRVVSSMVAVEEKTSGTDVLKRKRFTQLRIVNEKLERLVAETLQNQQRQIGLLERINEIKGLLVDLMS